MQREGPVQTTSKIDLDQRGTLAAQSADSSCSVSTASVAIHVSNSFALEVIGILRRFEVKEADRVRPSWTILAEPDEPRVKER